MLTTDLMTYSGLKRQVRETFARGQERTADAVERERVQTYWEVGKLVHEHVVLHKDRAEYGQQVIKRLSADLDMSNTQLKYMLEFARTPIGPHVGQLNWSEVRALLAINNDQKRKNVAERTVKENWSREALRAEIKKIKAENSQAVVDDLEEELLVPIKGELNHYRIVIAEGGPWQGKPVIDLGFASYYRPPGDFPFHEGDIVAVNGMSLRAPKGRSNLRSEIASSAAPPRNDKWDGHSFNVQKIPNATEVDLFTYRAHVLEVTDGDTIWLWIDLGFGMATKQQVRLRGIDAPEIVTRDGQAAKEFVELSLRGLRPYGSKDPEGARRATKFATKLWRNPSVRTNLAEPFGGQSQSEIASPATKYWRVRNDDWDDLPSVTITSTKSDKYDRYLADIFYESKKGEQCLNNRLLEQGLAERVYS